MLVFFTLIILGLTHHVNSQTIERIIKLNPQSSYGPTLYYDIDMDSIGCLEGLPCAQPRLVIYLALVIHLAMSRRFCRYFQLLE